MGPCGGKEKKTDPKQDEQVIKQKKIADLQSEINNLHIQVAKLNTEIVRHQQKNEIDKQKTLEWGIYINKVERDKLLKQIESNKKELQHLKIFSSLPLQVQQEYNQQRAISTLR